MLSVRFPLERGGPPRLEVAFADGYRTMRVRCDGQPVATAPISDLRAGRSYELPDGRILRILRDRRLWIWVDDRPVPGTWADPYVRVRSAPAWIFGMGIVALLRAWDLFRTQPESRVGWYGLSLAGVLLLSAMAMRRGILVAHLLAAAVAVGWIGWSLVMVQSGDDAPLLARALGSLVLVMFLAWVLYKILVGIVASREIAAQRSTPSTGTTPSKRG